MLPLLRTHHAPLALPAVAYFSSNMNLPSSTPMSRLSPQALAFGLLHLDTLPSASLQSALGTGSGRYTSLCCPFPSCTVTPWRTGSRPI
ncbi:uncharacterized protein K444DRAFT_390270 [Hyaloscypha bicolor E]|uniref:Uncharacterized protein n=1 Tax=Hyaloscypha bicolor E TaxID=1095630 RepID=A0A2J6TBB3_9HELO|nr:uncharacterized protein K444DRAFT_390270 [Hyaloscypha bicolor E]PMD60311.1 hypothetical protein K444DRAFT_390270 [Hyaloscypha bicolor E]